MIDFTLYSHPVLAIPCPDCGRKIGVMCRHPSGHKASNFHARRQAEADRRFIEQHGASASIERTENGWRIDREGRTRADRSP
jgi:hypothetical protein